MSQFTQVPILDIPTNSFDLSHHVNLTCDGGYIVPVECVEALPKDSFSYNNKTLVRLAPMISPALAKMDVTMITGFVPIRLLWPNAEKFFANPVPDENTPVAPYFDGLYIESGQLGDYLGIPTGTFTGDDGMTHIQYSSDDALNGISALPFAAYQKFYNDWFRDENLVNGGEETFTPLVDGLNVYANYSTLRKRAWRHDYFTSNLPFAQKGEAVEIPIGTFAPIQYDSSFPGALNPVFTNLNGANEPTATAAPNISWVGSPSGTIHGPNNLIGYDPKGTLQADLTNATAVTINSLRWAEKLQVFLEKNARGGTRYTEIVRQHFGQRSSDARLQRAEFLGFSVNPVIISEVLQTSPSQEDTTPLGEMAGHGISYGGTKFVNYHAEEHGFFITMMSIRPKTAYMQGLSRMWTRKSPLEYAWPTFAQLGEQETLNREIYITGDPEVDEATFGYLPRYAEYRYESDRVAGEMRSSYVHWHMTRIFNELPALNQAFIECNPSKRIFAVNLAGVHSYIVSVQHNLTVRRALPKYGIPAL